MSVGVWANATKFSARSGTTGYSWHTNAEPYPQASSDLRMRSLFTETTLLISSLLWHFRTIHPSSLAYLYFGGNRLVSLGKTGGVAGPSRDSAGDWDTVGRGYRGSAEKWGLGRAGAAIPWP